MRKGIVLLILTGVITCLHAQSINEIDKRPITRSTMYGAGSINLYDTYLSPLEYTGVQMRVVRESNRMTPWLNNKLSRQVLFQGHLASANNPTETANELSGMVNWNYALHYNLSFFHNQLQLWAGPMLQLHGGFTYNTRNGNNPAQARLATNLAASEAIHYQIPWRVCPLSFRYQLDAPFLGIMFSPQYGQSYYEIFSLGHSEGTIVCTSLHNQPTLRHWLTADVVLRHCTFRLGYMADMQQSRVNGLRAHDYSHSFLIGIVKQLTIEN